MSRKEASIVPDLNTVAVFSTDESSYHGHPDPLSCPEGVTRDSIALYTIALLSQPTRGEPNAVSANIARGAFRILCHLSNLS